MEFVYVIGVRTFITGKALLLEWRVISYVISFGVADDSSVMTSSCADTTISVGAACSLGNPVSSDCTSGLFKR